jgi:predicted transglutaminase-like cysteine proteinase
MLVRVAACAAFVFVRPIGTHIAGDDGVLPLPEIVIEIGRQPANAAQRNDTEAENQAPRTESDDAASAAERLQPAETNPPAASESALAFEPEPFGLGAEPVVDGEILAKWGGVEAQIKVENRELARCRSGGSWCPRAARRFLAIVNVGHTLTGRARIGVINREINLSIVPTSDLAQWGVADRWSAPLETFRTQRGDCEDYAIAKYVALRDAGVAPEEPRRCRRLSRRRLAHPRQSLASAGARSRNAARNTLIRTGRERRAPLCGPGARRQASTEFRPVLKHDPEKWTPVSRLREATLATGAHVLRFGGRSQVGKHHAQTQTKAKYQINLKSFRFGR